MASNQHEAVVGQAQMFKVAISGITIREGFNQRRDYGDLQQLANEIIAKGEVTEPFTLGQDKEELWLVNGHRRMQALELANTQLEATGQPTIDVVPAKIKKGLKMKEALVLQVMTNDNKPFTMMEEGNLYNKMLQEGMSRDDIHKATGRSKSSVSHALTLQESSDEVKEALERGDISESTARKIVQRARKSESGETQAFFLDEVMREGSKAADPKATKTGRSNAKVAAIVTEWKNFLEVGYHFPDNPWPVITEGKIDAKMPDNEEDHVHYAYMLGRLAMVAELAGATLEEVPALIPEDKPKKTKKAKKANGKAEEVPVTTEASMAGEEGTEADATV